MFLFYIVANHADGTCCIEIKRHTITPPVGWDRLPFCKTAQRLNPPSMMFNQWSMYFFFLMEYAFATEGHTLRIP